LQDGWERAARELGAETRLIKLNDLSFRACEGYYSKAARACTWPCSITEMDAKDKMDQVYEALVHWADAVNVATPIRWGTASSLYFKMAERLNCVQNAITIRNQVLIRNKVAGFIIIGGQDNIQAVAWPDARFFRRTRFPLSTISVYRPLARLVARGHGSERRDRARIEAAC
jgi:multimeric flavodoxin WrbA